MSAQIKPLEMNEDRYKVVSPFYGEKDYAFSFEFASVNAVWQGRAVDSASLVAKPNIWMGEERQDHYSDGQREGAADERVFAYREGRGFTLVCLNDQLYLMLRIWEEDEHGNVSLASRRAKSALKVATRTVSGKTEPLMFSHADPCIVKLETQGGVSTVKVWNTQKAGEAPFILGDFGEDFKSFFSAFTEFQFNTIPLAVKNGRHSLKLERVAAWRGNAQPEGKGNFRDFLDEKKQLLKGFGYRQLPLQRLSAYYPFEKNRWDVLDNGLFHTVDTADFEITATQGLCFDAFKNKCSLTLRPSVGQGASASLILNVLLDESRLFNITTVSAQIDVWGKSEPVLSRRKHWLNFKRFLEDIETFDPAKPFVLSPSYKDGSLAEIIKAGVLTHRLPNFMKQLGVSNFEVESQIKDTIRRLQLKLNEDKKLLYERRDTIGMLRFKASTSKSAVVFRVQVLRRMNADAAGAELSYEEKVVFQDTQGHDQGATDLKHFPGFLLLSLSDDRKAFNVFFARSGSDLSGPLVATLTYTAPQAADQAPGYLDEVILELGVGAFGMEGPMITVKNLGLWNTALWQRGGLVTGGDKLDQDYNVKTLAHLGFSGSLNPLIVQYKKSLKA
ncbi:hypothetical protein [Pseudomonas sp. MWU13-2105]|uniref:hypothetical protein n=1 Tax=Pseudomonas sp. MWU13-2105 TaxID=2935074 RepID=UPI00200FC48F|nr:hypothetical protein [Pseudomonas sp. MWU13-2105]